MVVDASFICSLVLRSVCVCVLGRYTLTRFTRHHQTASLISRLQETHKTEGWHEDSQTCTNQLKTRETHFSRETGTKEHIYYWILAVMQGGTMRNNSASAYHFPYIYICKNTSTNKCGCACILQTDINHFFLAVLEPT